MSKDEIKKQNTDEDIEKSVSSSSSDEKNLEEDQDAKEPTVKREMTVKDLKINNPYSKSNKIGADFAKYLLNLDPDSAYYDGKSRSMRGNPNPNADDSTFKGDNFIRTTGDAMQYIELENFVKEANSKNFGQMLNNISMPSQAELFHRYYKDRKVKVHSENLKKAISKYGGEEHLEPPDEIKNYNTSSSTYVEYNPSGKGKKWQKLKKKIALPIQKIFLLTGIPVSGDLFKMMISGGDLNAATPFQKILFVKELKVRRKTKKKL